MFDSMTLFESLVTDRHDRFEAQARNRRRLTSAFRRSPDRVPAPVEADGAARQPTTLGRTPSVVERRAA